ncbi:MAG: RtcB family protein [Oscillospiraceae bacterium]|nr:RtcB family protein [Oscillospiraceae bacterium]
MKEVNGKYNSAKVFTDVVEDSAIAQIKELCDQEFVQNEKIRIMPDAHAGAGCVIGTTMTITDKIVPNLVGVDIGCGMETVKIKGKHIELMQLDKLIYRAIPSGFDIRNTAHRYAEQIDLTELKCKHYVNLDRAEKSLGTLGGGNHFIEADKGDDGSVYIVVHSGSRHLGVEVAKYYQEMGYKQLVSEYVTNKDEENKLIEELKAQGRQQDIQNEIAKLRNGKTVPIPKHLAYVSGELFNDYIHDMRIVQRFAELNRKAMMDEILKGMGLKAEEQFTTIHNYIDTENMILRKGSVSAQSGEKLIIPINMRDGSLICKGKGNPDWNYSAPHGAGRLMSRSAARESFTVSEFKKQMKGIYSTSVCSGTLDECPMAYKGMDDIVNNIGDTAEIISIIKPIYNFKAKDEDK